MALLDDALDSLRDLRILLEGDGSVSHVLINLRRGRTREDKWKRLITEQDLSRQFVETISEAVITAQVSASEPDGISEFDFDAISSGVIGVLRLADFPELEVWLAEVPENDWHQPFRPTHETRNNLHHYVVRLTTPTGQTLEAFRSSRGAKIFIEHGGICAVFRRDLDLARPAADGFMSFDEKVDFFAWDGFLYIVNLGSFESITNIRVITQAHAHAAVDIIAERCDLVDVVAFKATVGSKISLSKKLAAAVRYGLIDAIDSDRVISRIAEKRLELVCENRDGRLIFDVDPANINQVSEIVNLLSDVYLQSPVTQKEWRALVKKPAWN